MRNQSDKLLSDKTIGSTRKIHDIEFKFIDVFQ